MKLTYKIVILVLTFTCLIIGVLSGMVRLGWNFPLPEVATHHGAIMVGGFLGSLIALEKIIPLKMPFLLVGPISSASSVWIFFAGSFQYAVIMLLFASLILVSTLFIYLKRQYTLYMMLALIGSLCLVTGNILLAWNKFYPLVFPWWMGFLVLTIVSERLELAKFLPVPQSRKMILIAFIALFGVGIVMPFHSFGRYLTGLALIFVSIWLLRYDLVRLTITKSGLTRYTGIALACGYIALLLDGIFLIALQEMPLGYDIIVHTFFLGFVFAMIFAHGPIILPGALGLTVKPYHRLFFLPLIILFFSLALRIAADTLLLPMSLRYLSGWISAGAILFYFILMAIRTVYALKHPD
ncbi:MAG TPA: hypothetical protein PKJ63_09335 [Cyclobacteriaceae bacterium]|nr:hypothetical protein [Cyclobacteriaceae bacterium]